MTCRDIRGQRRGFTLVEILIVVVILGILASIAVPQFSDATAQSRTNAAASIVRTVQAKVFEDFATEGEYAETINPDWFVEGRVPINPLAAGQTSPTVLNDTAATAEITHPAIKVVGPTGAFWYNSTNGSFRALVPAQGTPEETLELYNAANSADLSDINATSG